MKIIIALRATKGSVNPLISSRCRYHKLFVRRADY